MVREYRELRVRGTGSSSGRAPPAPHSLCTVLQARPIGLLPALLTSLYDLQSRHLNQPKTSALLASGMTVAFRP